MARLVGNRIQLILVGGWALFASGVTSGAVGQQPEQSEGAAFGTRVTADTGQKTIIRELGPLRKVFRHEKLRQGIKPENQTHFAVRVYIRREDGASASVWVGDGPMREAIALGEKGALLWRASPALFKRNPMVYTDVPKGELNFVLSLVPLLPVETKENEMVIMVEDLRLAVSQVNRGIGKAAGIVSFAVPKLRRIVAEVPEGEALMVCFDNGVCEDLPKANLKQPDTENYYAFNTRDKKLKKALYLTASQINDPSFSGR